MTTPIYGTVGLPGGGGGFGGGNTGSVGSAKSGGGGRYGNPLKNQQPPSPSITPSRDMMPMNSASGVEPPVVPAGGGGIYGRPTSHGHGAPPLVGPSSSLPMASTFPQPLPPSTAFLNSNEVVNLSHSPSPSNDLPWGASTRDDGRNVFDAETEQNTYLNAMSGRVGFAPSPSHSPQQQLHQQQQHQEERRMSGAWGLEPVPVVPSSPTHDFGGGGGGGGGGPVIPPSSPWSHPQQHSPVIPSFPEPPVIPSFATQGEEQQQQMPVPGGGESGSTFGGGFGSSFGGGGGGGVFGSMSMPEPEDEPSVTALPTFGKKKKKGKR